MSVLASRVLLDTNVLVYAYDVDADLQPAAIGFIERLSRSGKGLLSAQVLAEFFAVATRKLTTPLTPAQGHQRILALRRLFPVLDVTSLIVAEAARGVATHHLSFWDAMVWATCRLNQVPCILTQDLPRVGEIEGVAFFDPFAKGFDVSRFV